MGDGHMERQNRLQMSLLKKGNEQHHRPEEKALAQEARLVKRKEPQVNEYVERQK